MLNKIKKSKVFGTFFSGIAFIVFMILTIVKSVQNGGLHYHVDENYLALFYMILMVLVIFWRFCMLVPVLKDGIESKNSGLILFAISGMFGFLIFETIIFFINRSKNMFTIHSEDEEFEDKYSKKLEEYSDIKEVKANRATSSNKAKSTSKSIDKLPSSILLTCASAASTGILANLVKKVVKSKGLDVNIEALPFGDALRVYNEYDVLLIAPQASFKYKDFKAGAKPGTKVIKIPADVYGKFDGELILSLATK